MHTARLLTEGLVLSWGWVGAVHEGGAVQGGGGAVHNRKWHHNTPLWTEWLTDRYKNITLPKLTKGIFAQGTDRKVVWLRTVKISVHQNKTEERVYDNFHTFPKEVIRQEKFPQSVQFFWQSLYYIACYELIRLLTSLPMRSLRLCTTPQGAIPMVTMLFLAWTKVSPSASPTCLITPEKNSLT